MLIVITVNYSLEETTTITDTTLFSDATSMAHCTSHKDWRTALHTHFKVPTQNKETG